MSVTTFTTTEAEDVRLAAAFGKTLNLPGPASAAQVKAAIKAYMVKTVRMHEQQAAIDAAIASIPLIDPT